jgi:hypothetical protein
MKRYNYIVIIMMFLAVKVAAQDQTQAIRFSQNFPVGTARYTAMGGAFGAIGGDFTAVSQNPGGLGLYRGSEFTITPTYTLSNATSEYLGQSSGDHTNNLSIGNMGMVTAFNSNRNNGIVGTVFAIGYNTLRNFNNAATMQGVNNSTSLLDDFAYHANNYNTLDGFYEDLAFQTGLMPLDTALNTYWHYLEPYDAIGYDGYGQEQVRVVEKRGYIGEYALSTAVNFNNMLYVGGTFGIHALRFYEDVYHKETDFNDLEPFFDAFRFGEYNTTRGYGYIFRIGMIYRPIHILRFGASFHAPVTYYLTDDKFTDLNTYWDVNSGMTDDYASSGLFSKDYTLRTPYRASLSTAVLLGKMGIISAEYEYADYSQADLDSPGYKFNDENISISRDFGVTHNLKAGAELRLNPVYIRGGVQYFMNPYTDERNGSDMFVYSGGIGFRSNQTFIDLAYSLGMYSELYGLYQHSPEFEGGFEKAHNSYNITNVKVTVGYKF